ncbi:MAG: hypothetical protein NTZ83_04325 [Candidatus Pacearchaeota archaeon]|nr:hypothetical protein [Candidatus Pacearchaeota archaeon]
MIECDGLYTPANDPVFDALKAEEAKIIKEVTEEFNTASINLLASPEYFFGTGIIFPSFDFDE